MNVTAKRRARANPATAETNVAAMQQMMALSLARAENELRHLAMTRCDDGEWSDADTNVELAVDLALSHVCRMKVMNFDEFSAFQGQWFLAMSAVSLARRAFSRPSSFYGQLLAGVESMFEQAAEFVEYAANFRGEAAATA